MMRIVMGDIGEEQEEIEFEPWPDSAPLAEPTPSIPTPEKEPAPV